MAEFSNREYKLSSDLNLGSDLLSYRAVPKRCVDLIGCLILVPLILPIIGALWLIARSDGGSGFFAHERVGMNGKKFKCLKIRSMRVDAAQYLDDYLASNPEARAEWDRDHKLQFDPRITAFGQFIRKCSLDELPQLFNVLAGDMSFVGPRPITEKELARYGQSADYYLALKPGITGLWQTSGRNNVTYDERVAMDVSYHKHVSFLMDVWLILKTVKSVLAKEGL